jgi:hypothetical protein
MQKISKFPRLRKKISAFIMGEDGRISKQNLMALGALLGTATLATVLLSGKAAAYTSSTCTNHTNTISVSVGADGVSATHSHNITHSNCVTSSVWCNPTSSNCDSLYCGD